MADFPRWIPAYNVDSVAMYSAYQECLVVSPGISRYLGFKGHLTFIEHDAERLGNPAGAPQMDVRITPCPERGCQRCVQGRGGYTFRWYSPLWDSSYCRHARPGAWLPGMDEQADNPNQVWHPRNSETWRLSTLNEGFRVNAEGHFIEPNFPPSGYYANDGTWRERVTLTQG